MTDTRMSVDEREAFLAMYTSGCCPFRERRGRLRWRCPCGTTTNLAARCGWLRVASRWKARLAQKVTVKVTAESAGFSW